MKDFFTASVLAACALAGIREDIAECDADGKTWDVYESECITVEQSIANYLTARCVEDGGEWKNDYCQTSSPYEKCQETGGAFDFYTEECFKNYEEMDAAMQEREQKECDKDGDEWKIFREGESYFQCYRGTPEQDCYIAEKYWDWDNETCITWEEFQMKQCAEGGYDCTVGTTTEEGQKRLNIGWEKEQYSPGNCHALGKHWNYKNETCMTFEEEEMMRCAERGDEWIVDDVDGYCYSPVEACYGAGKYWNYKNSTCMTWEEQEMMRCAEGGDEWIFGTTTVEGYCTCERAVKYWSDKKKTCISWEEKLCGDVGMDWIETATPAYCSFSPTWPWSLKRVIERIPAQHRAKALASILIDLDLTTLKEIGEPVEEGEKKGDELMKEVMIELARKQGQHAAASSNAGMYAGISFGVIGLVAAGAMFAANNKKQVAENEESLL